jgi:hypothetical protein
MNIEIDAHVAQAFNRQFVGQFAYFENVRHLITNYDDLTVDMTWTGYSLIKNAGRKVTFARNS